MNSEAKNEKFPPFRIATRLLSEMHAATAGPGVKMVGGDLNRFAILSLAVHQSLGDSPGISAYSLASSLKLPYETVRRQIGMLIKQGWLQRSGSNAIIASPATLASPVITQMMALVHDSFVRFVADLAKLKAIPLPPAQAAARRFTLQDGVQATTDILLVAADGNRYPGHDLTDASIFAFVIAANVRFYARDPVLAWRYPDHRTPLPEGLNVPVRASALAWACGHAENTVRRRIKAMVATGWLVKTRGGLIVSDTWMNDPVSVAVSLSTYQNLKRLFVRFAAEGFPFTDPESAYIVGRPADTSFGPPG